MIGGNALRAAEFAFGADLSFLKQAEDHGKIFKDGTNVLPGLQIFKNHGYHWIRLRLFVEPVSNNLPNDLPYTLAEARAAKKLGYKFLLDFHYANSWADPGKQPTPGAWVDLTHQQRSQKVFEYTRDSIAAFRDAGAPPDMVQIGNEVRVGMLWPDGRLPEHWDNFADYLRAGIKGVTAGCGKNPPPKIMIHFDQGGDVAQTKYFFDNLTDRKISFDVIGFSYYPWWHGSLMNLRENLAFTANTYHKDIVIVETAYNWRPARESGGKAEPFPETPEGQREFLEELTRVALANEHCAGIFWWEPATLRTSSRGFFDENGNSLPVLNVFDQYAQLMDGQPTNETQIAARRENFPANTNLPSVFFIGDSTVRNGRGNGAGGQWGWGDQISVFFNTSKINVVNRALGGTTARTFYRDFWPRTLALIKSGDAVLMQFGTNGGPINDASRARGELHGIGDETQDITNQITKKFETVHTFGWYEMKMIEETRAKGATAIICSLIPRNAWHASVVARPAADSAARWAENAAKAARAPFIDLSEIISRQYDRLGQEKVKELFVASAGPHTSLAGAQTNAICVIAGLKSLKENPLANYFSDAAGPIAPANLLK